MLAQVLAHYSLGNLGRNGCDRSIGCAQLVAHFILGTFLRTCPRQFFGKGVFDLQDASSASGAGLVAGWWDWTLSNPAQH